MKMHRRLLAVPALRARYLRYVGDIAEKVARLGVARATHRTRDARMHCLSLQLMAERPLVFQHGKRELRVCKSTSASYSGTFAFMFGHPLWPGGLRLDGYRDGMSRRDVKALAIAAAEAIDAHYKHYVALSGTRT